MRMKEACGACLGRSKQVGWTYKSATPEEAATCRLHAIGGLWMWVDIV